MHTHRHNKGKLRPSLLLQWHISWWLWTPCAAKPQKSYTISRETNILRSETKTTKMLVTEREDGEFSSFNTSCQGVCDNTLRVLFNIGVFLFRVISILSLHNKNHGLCLIYLTSSLWVWLVSLGAFFLLLSQREIQDNPQQHLLCIIQQERETLLYYFTFSIHFFCSISK